MLMIIGTADDGTWLVRLQVENFILELGPAILEGREDVGCLEPGHDLLAAVAVD